MTRFSGLVLTRKFLLIFIKLCVRIAADFIWWLSQVVAANLDIARSYSLWIGLAPRHVEFTRRRFVRVISCDLARSSGFVVTCLVLWWDNISSNFRDFHRAWHIRLDQYGFLLGTILFLCLLTRCCTTHRLLIFTIVQLSLSLFDKTILFFRLFVRDMWNIPRSTRWASHHDRALFSRFTTRRQV